MREGIRPTNTALEQRKQQWEQTLAGLNQIRDGLGHGIEEGIKEAVVGLQLRGFKTTGSCEGHNDWGLPYPWVQMQAEGEPQYRWEGEEDMRQQLMSELHVRPEELERGSPTYSQEKRERVQDVFFDRLPDDAPETREYVEWSQRNADVAKQLEELIMKFYAGTESQPTEPRLAIEKLFAGHEPRLVVSDAAQKSDEAEVRKMIDEKTTPSSELTERVQRRQGEMREFAEFPKREFLSGN